MDTKVLNRKRGNIKTRITKYEADVADETKSMNTIELKSRLDSVKDLKAELDDLKEKYYEVLSDEELKDQEQQLIDLYFRLENLEVRIKILIHSLKTDSNAVPNVDASKQKEHSNIKLPDIPLPSFDGKYEEWFVFKEQFMCLISENNVNDSQKLYYLQAALKGSAKQLQTSDDTYETLLKALKERYENKRIIVDMHINALINVEKMSHESAKDLRNLIDKLLKHVRALKTLKFENNNFSEILLINIILQKLDRETRKQFELSIESVEVPTWQTFIQFLEKRCQVLESLNRNVSVKPKFQFEQNSRSRASMFNYNAAEKRCIACNLNSQHPLHKCATFLNMNAYERYELVKKGNLCYNCLNDHKLSKCKSKGRCFTCSKFHHTLIHKPKPELHSSVRENKQDVPATRSDFAQGPTENPATFDPCSTQAFFPNNENVTLSATTNLVNTKTVLLSTAVIQVADCYGKYSEGRCVLDSGSMCNFMTAEFANKLGLRKQKTYAPVSGVNGSPLVLKAKVQTTISNDLSTYRTPLEFLILSKITDLTSTNCLQIDIKLIPDQIKLADPRPGKIDLLIGNEIFFDLLREGKFRLLDQSIILQNTVFGYVISGYVNYNSNIQFCGLSTQFDDLEKNMQRFWQIESIEEKSRLLSPEEEFCEKHFADTHYRNELGRYVVHLPLKEDNILGESKNFAEKRLNALWRRLSSNTKMKNLYVDFMDEYEKLGHMKEIVHDNSHTKSYYMPHHGVYRPEKQTTQLRVVFNASSPTSNGLSLNDILLNGGFIQDELFSILSRFRTHKYAFTADIQKMYRQILIHPQHRDYQRILWKRDIHSPIKTYQLQTVTYGTTSASFLATRVLRQLALDEGARFPLASAVVLSDFYVDDVLSGSNDLSIAKKTKEQLVEMFQKCGMILHKWCSNSQELCADMTVNNERSFHGSYDASTKALGMLWTPSSDTFSFKVSLNLNDVMTKRNVLSYIARIFDPMGLIGPVTTKAKILMQSLWFLKMSWNDILPDDVKNEWEKFAKALPAIQNIHLPRHIGCDGQVFLHGFADASSLAYGCVIYLQCISLDNKISTKLVCSKSRVAPIKTISIPRLELCACLLLAKLVQKILPALRMRIDKIFLWSDSTIALTWIHKAPCLLKTFVANRVSSIQDLTKEYQWNHISSDLNPADAISRGLYGDQIVQDSLWWQGPHFLTEQVEFSTCDSDLSVDSDALLSEMKPDKKSVFTAVTSDTWVQNIIERISNYLKLIRTLSFLFRFIHNVRNPHNKISGPLSAKETKDAELVILREIQNGEFFQEINFIRKGLSVSPKSKLRFLNPFLDKNGVLRVGGRLKHSNLNFESKFPVILPANNKLTNLMFRYYHLKNLHIGPSGLLHSIRQRFWPINGRNIARKIVHECVKCFKAKPIPSEQLLGDLPYERVNQNYVFNCTGIDFCGPFLIRYKNQRKGVCHKIYVCIFVCLVTRAIHLETVTDLTSESFIATLKRFFSRRGKSSKLFSDNAKTFVGAYAELKKLNNMVKAPDEKLAGYLSSEGIQWNFIPPRSPNFGGLWEAGVKSFKYYLKRVVGDAKLTIEEFITVTNQIEGILNSRPITPLSSDPEDLDVLTPAHFLIGRPINSIPESDHSLLPDNRLSHWQRVTKLTQLIWKRWSNTFLSNLQQRSKWMFSKNNVTLGSLVIIKEDNMPICKWLMGRIVQVYPGADGKIRVVDVKTKNGIFKRAVTKICVLPVEN